MDSSQNRFVRFNDLFKNSSLASMLCSNIIYDKFKEYDYKNLPVVKAQIEVEPRNYIIYPNGIEFIINRGIIAPDTVDSTVFISVNDLMAAEPNEKWFPVLKVTRV